MKISGFTVFRHTNSLPRYNVRARGGAAAHPRTRNPQNPSKTPEASPTPAKSFPYIHSSKSQTNDHRNEEPMTKPEGENVTEQQEGDDGEASTVSCSRWKRTTQPV